MLPAFGWQAVLTRWQSAPVVTAFVVIAAGLYLWGVVRVARRHPARPWPAWRTGMFLGGLVIVLVALQSGIGTYDDVLFWDHMVQHLLLVMVAPPLLIFGQPITLLMHASRNPVHTWIKRVVRSPVASFLTWPAFGFAAYAAAIVVAHLTGLANLTARNQFAHEFEHVAFLVIGYLFFLPIIGSEPIRWRLSYPTRLVLLFLVMPVDTFTGLVLTYGNRGTPGLPIGPRPTWAETAVAQSNLIEGSIRPEPGGQARQLAVFSCAVGKVRIHPNRHAVIRAGDEFHFEYDSALDAAAGEFIGLDIPLMIFLRLRGTQVKVASHLVMRACFGGIEGAIGPGLG